MNRRIVAFVVLIGLLSGGLITLASGQVEASSPFESPAQIEVTQDRAFVMFPRKIIFSVKVESAAEIDDVILEYGVVRLTCGEVIAKAFPPFEPSSTVEAKWTWEMKKSGSLPPGATIWWRWRIVDVDGDELLTDRQTTTWLDESHTWQTISADSIRLHWYEGDQAFAEELHAAAVDALVYLEQYTGLTPDDAIDLYIYASAADLREAVYYEPGWIGGQAYADFNTVIIGISPQNMAWGKKTEAHELTHVLVGRFTFSCLGGVPTWLNEGLAEFVERGDEGLGEDRSDFEAAIAEDTLFSVRALGGSFPEDQERAHLAYVQSYSVVDFLIAEYGSQDAFDLLAALRDGVAIDEALQMAYGFDGVDGLEDAWREHVGAAPRLSDDATPTPVATVVPTLAPIARVPLATVLPSSTPPPSSAPTRTPVPAATGMPKRTPTETAASAGDEGAWFAIGGGALFGTVACLAVVIVLGLIVVVVRRRKERV